MRKSCNIGFLLAPEHSCFNAAFGLAHALQERGHDIVFYVGYKSILWDYVESHGFKAAKVASLVEGRTAKANEPAGLQLWKRLTRRARNARPDDIDLVDSIKPDLCLLDSLRDDIYPTATLLAETGVPTILLSANFASTFQTGCPPVFSSMLAPDTRKPAIRSRVTFALLWLWAVCASGRGIEGSFRRLRRTSRKLFNRVRNVRWERRLRRLGWGSSWSEWKRRPLIPEIVFGHRTLDWPAIATAERFYFGVTDLFRNKGAFDWSIVESNRPVVYCNISTAGRFQDSRASASGGRIGKPDASRKNEFGVAKRYLDVVIDAFSQRKDWQLILVCGPLYESLRGGAVSPNIHLFARVPSQLAVLEHADLAIIWGGAGSVRECVNFGVPMLVFPVWTDEFGNAARVLSRNLGIRGDFLNVTPTQMVEMAERVLTDKTIRASATEFQLQLNKKNEVEDLVHFVRRHTSLEL